MYVDHNYRLVGGVAGCPVFGLVDEAGGNKFPEPSTLEPPAVLDTCGLALESQPEMSKWPDTG
ncbi:hypothetical protein DFH06DRAFT_1341338 [Mycena polygramma]|nr:hypothetical protein DFH06DRAFT_1341338 [Mycena polygramma]